MMRDFISVNEADTLIKTVGDKKILQLSSSILLRETTPLGTSFLHFQLMTRLCNDSLPTANYISPKEINLPYKKQPTRPVRLRTPNEIMMTSMHFITVQLVGVS